MATPLPVPWSELDLLTTAATNKRAAIRECRSSCSSPVPPDYIISDYDDSDEEDVSPLPPLPPPPLPPPRRVPSHCPTSSPCRYSLLAEQLLPLYANGGVNHYDVISEDDTSDECSKSNEHEDCTLQHEENSTLQLEEDSTLQGMDCIDGGDTSHEKRKLSVPSPYFTLTHSSFNIVTASIHATLPRALKKNKKAQLESKGGTVATNGAPPVKDHRSVTTRPSYDVSKLQHRRGGSEGQVVEDVGTSHHFNTTTSSDYTNDINAYDRCERRKSISCLDLAKPKELQNNKNIGTMPPSSKNLAVVAGIAGKIKKLPNLHKAKTAKALCKMLSHPGVDPNARDKHSDTPLHTFVRKAKVVKNVERLVALLSCGKNVNIDELDGDDNTALHVAVKNDDMHTVGILVAFGANTKITNAHNMTPIELAQPSGHLRDFLSQFVSKPNFNAAVSRNRGYTLPVTGTQPTPDMLGFYLNWRREARLCLDMEIEIDRMLQEEIINDIGQAAAGFMQLNHVKKWQQTRGKLSCPGSRVLFLDGGGIRGLTTIEILMEIEIRTEKRIVELFDWIIGTSTGAIVALGLVYAKMTLSEVRDFYLRTASSVFGGSFLQSEQNSANMEKVLIEIFGPTLMSSVTEPRVMVSAVNISETSLEVQFFNNFNGIKELTEVPVWMVARATSAAPTYFTPFNGYVDGGVKANNPCEFAMSEIVRYYDSHSLTPPHFPVIVSVGTCHFPAQKLDNFSTAFTKNLKDVIYTPKRLFDLLVYAISNSEEVAKKFESQMKTLDTPFFRFNPFMKDEVKANETDPNTLLDLIIETKVYLMKKEVLGDLYEMVQVFHQLEDMDDSVTDFL